LIWVVCSWYLSVVVLGREREIERERERNGMADQDSVVEEIAKLNVDQLRQVKEQVESELSVLQDSLVNIRTAATRFEMASKALNTLSLQPAGKKMLVPLTASLYAAGTLTNPESILVDVGTGYYIEVRNNVRMCHRHWQ
jgi:hypothetical protein